MAEQGNAKLPGAPFGRTSRGNDGAWRPLVDWVDVYPGNRWKDRHGQFGLFDSPSGIQLKVEEASVSDVLFAEDTDWEGGMLALDAWQDDDRYHMLYRATGGTAYAYSGDGYQWTKPEVGRVDFEGSTKNNLVCDEYVGGMVEDPSAPTEERFKAMKEVAGFFDPETGEELDGEEGLKRMGDMEHAGDSYSGPRMVMRAYMRGFTSPDRMHWKQIEQPVGNMPSDGSGSNPMYEPETGTFFAYIRSHGLSPGELCRGLANSTVEEQATRRSIGLTRTKDFYNWPPPKMVLYADAHDGPHISFYGGFYFRYPGRTDMHCMLVHIFDQISGHVDNQIAFSRDGLIWNRPERRASIPPGPPGSDYDGTLYAQGGLVELPDESWAVAFGGGRGLHNGFHPGMPMPQEPRAMRWARWQPHRLCGIEAEAEGHFTIPTLDRSRNELRLNYRTENGGWVKVEARNKTPSRKYPDGVGHAGRTFGDCDWIFGDEGDRVVTWNGDSDISAVGDTISIRIRMFRAKIFAFQV